MSCFTIETFSLQVIIDSQPLTVAILAALLFGESIGLVGAVGLVLGVVGLLLLEVKTSLISVIDVFTWDCYIVSNSYNTILLS